MTEAAALIARFLYQGGNLLLFGSLGILLLADPAPALSAWRRRTLLIAAAVAVVTCVAAVAVLFIQAGTLPGHRTSGSDLLRRLVSESRFGNVWLARWILLIGCATTIGAAGLFFSGRQQTLPVTIAWTLAGGSLVLVPFAGHSVTAEPAWPSLAAHCLHLLAAGAWFGGLLPITDGVRIAIRDRPPMLEPLRSVMERFSALALPAMMLIVASGIWIAFAQIETVPALLATPYGLGVVAKSAVLAVVLALAAHLRRRLLPRWAGEPGAAREFAGAVAVEWGFALLVVLLATWLAQTVPARHDSIRWWLPFRVSVDATWTTAWVPPAALSSLAAVLIGGGLFALGLRRRARLHAATGLLIAAAGCATGVYAMSVDAYPDTYRKPSVPYQTISVAAGAGLFRDRCARCHGADGHGAGPDAAGLARRPADLTEPHTALHTAGDIFWWLSHGKPPGVMPGFAEQLSEDERWDLVNYLRTLSAGYQARILGVRVVPGLPWLAAIDFNFVDQHDSPSTLKDFRGQAVVLLVFYTAGSSDARLRQLAADEARLRAAGAKLVAVPVDGNPGRIANGPFRVVGEGGAETVAAYSLLRRTLADADPRDRAPTPAHMEFLVDRFGYIRARRMPESGGDWPDLVHQIETLATEPQVRLPPEDHVH